MAASVTNAFPIHLHNTLTRQVEPFEPLSSPHVGMYVCGPTVYGSPHLGHARSAVTFDVLVRLLRFVGYSVRYVRNVTDVGHLTEESEQGGEDKIAKKARLEKVEPMEVVQQYTVEYHQGMDALNCLRPSIEPTASGHIPEQIALIERLMEAGYAYEVQGSVYFDLNAYQASEFEYGALSGKVLEELQQASRGTLGQDEKRSPHDFALWKRADESHIMRWPSPWGEGFPGWHLECTAMSTKYLGERFDIHGGGLDLQFPHHEAEIAQACGAHGTSPANVWMHHNMVTLEGAKMSKSSGNFVTLQQLFDGNHALLSKGYEPMVVRFLLLQSHYQSPIDFSDRALQAAEKGLDRLMGALELSEKFGLSAGDQGANQGVNQGTDQGAKGTEDLEAIKAMHQTRVDANGAESLEVELLQGVIDAFKEITQDLHTAKAIAALFGVSSMLQALANGQKPRSEVSDEVLSLVMRTYRTMVMELLGFEGAKWGSVDSSDRVEGLMALLLELRTSARSNHDYATSDLIRDRLAAQGITLKDGKGGAVEIEYGPVPTQQDSASTSSKT
jgi:cysteinyl-tRNA synthetase